MYLRKCFTNLLGSAALSVLLLLSYMVINSEMLYGQEVKTSISAKFDRKGVTFIPVALDNFSKFNNTIKEAALQINETGRFDNNYLSKAGIEKFQAQFLSSGFDAAKPKDEKQIDILKKLIKDNILEAALKSVTNPDSLKERFKRSQKRIIISSSSAEKINQATTADNNLLISNSYFAIALLENIDDNPIKATAKGKIYWFKLDLKELSGNDDWKEIEKDKYDKNNQWWFPNVQKINIELVNIFDVNAEAEPKIVAGKNAEEDKKLAADALNMVKNTMEEESESDMKLPLPNRAAKKIVKKIVTSAMGMEEFKLRGTVQSIDPQIALDLGNREGVYLDQGYKIFENRIGSDSKPFSEYIGFTRIKEIGDNIKDLNNDSKMFGIINSGSIEQGHTALSHDQFLDVYLKASFKLVNIPKNSGFFLEIITGNPIFDEDAKSSINFDLGAYYNLAKLSGVSQLFVGASVGIGLPTVKPNAKITCNFTINPPMTLEINLNVLKKMWFGRLNGYAECQFGLNSFKLTGTLIEKDWEINTGMNYGAGLNLGAEYALNADMNLAIEAGYRFVLPSTSITIIDTDGKSTDYKKEDNEEFWAASQYDDLNLGGIKFGIKFTYSLPPLF